jgi:hypothetical protein
MCTLGVSKIATYVVNIERSNSNFPLFLLDQTTFSFAIPGFLLVTLFLVPVISLYGALDYPLEENIYFLSIKFNKHFNWIENMYYVESLYKSATSI